MKWSGNLFEVGATRYKIEQIRVSECHKQLYQESCLLDYLTGKMFGSQECGFPLAC